MRPLVWSSHFHRTPLQMQASSLFYLVRILYHHQLFIDIKRENLYCVLDRVSFIEILAMINLYYSVAQNV